ncbi:unnamed protein product, partial [Mesorhabditis belari]|uniref:Vacuolar protein sorting-associated protein 16 homolog n=1 Tax=Mesorhabditis belari TaxID=2138241 RepID=A0AAF3ERR5_9BILA
MFDKASVIGDWIPLGHVKLKESTLYELSEKINLNKATHFAGCSYGGPIAIAESRDQASWDVMITTSSGRPLIKKPIRKGDVFGLGWSRAQRLLVIDRHGCVNRYRANGQSDESFYFSADKSEIIDYCIFNYGSSDTGMAVLDRQYRIWVVNSVKEAIPWLMQSPSGEKPSGWCAFHGSTLSTVIIVHGVKFMSGQQGEHMRPMSTPWAERDGQYVKIVPNWSISWIGLYHSKRLIQVVSTDFSKLFMTIPVPGDQQIIKFGWVGETSLFCQRSSHLIHFFASDSPTAIYEQQRDFSQIVIEPDGLRLHGDSHVTFIGPVSKSEYEVLGVASDSDGAFLFEASILAEQGKAGQAFEHLTIMVKDMNKAIAECLSAACNSMKTQLQKLLLKAVRFGVPFCTSFDPKSLVRAISLLRTINEVHLERTGIPITYEQLEELSVKSLVSRLVDIEAFGVAVRISSFSEETKTDGPDNVLLAWVKALFESVADRKATFDMTILDERIAEKFKEFPHVSFGDAARKAIDAGLPHLARLLINRESDEEKQVEVLLSLQDVSDALKLAARVQRPELLHQVIRHLMKHKNKAQYELEIQKIPQAQCLYAKYVTQRGGDGGSGGARMLALLEQSSDLDRKILYHIDMATQADPTLNNEEHVNNLKAARNIAAQLKEPSITDLLSLAVAQVNADWSESTARQRIIENVGEPSIIQATKQVMKLTDKEVTLWTIEGLALKRSWEQLFDMASKRCPVWIGAIHQCLSLLPQYKTSEKVYAHIALGSFVTAAKLAFDAKDRDLMRKLKVIRVENPEKGKAVDRGKSGQGSPIETTTIDTGKEKEKESMDGEEEKREEWNERGEEKEENEEKEEKEGNEKSLVGHTTQHTTREAGDLFNDSLLKGKYSQQSSIPSYPLQPPPKSPRRQPRQVERLSRMDTSTMSSRSAHSGLRTRSQGPRRPMTNREENQKIAGNPGKSGRSNSVTRILQDEKARSEAEDARRREQADAAFLEWLKRKMKAPREPKCSPTREQLEQHNRADARQKMLNHWHAKFPRSKSRSGGRSPDIPSIRYDATL